ncbi:hypothetical protein IWQ47_002491 [Aquimarina sp. EL_43]|nr:hypothetical protein [Aquimarina sp. EL_35]MBG6151480.1 hypothetical protein [Aquimarina sp. EL_32]MBG6169411.1 hypothetical protein [Aquimarina sp. EL_43]
MDFFYALNFVTKNRLDTKVVSYEYVFLIFVKYLKCNFLKLKLYDM